MLIHSTVFAITYNWNGVDADWDNPKAWTPMGVPGANDRAFIAAGEVTIPDQYNAEALSVHLQGGVLQITEDGSLSINNNSNLNAIWIYGLGSMVVKGQLHISNQLNQRFMTVEGRLHIDDTGEVTMDECTYCNPANGVVYIASSGGIVNDGLMSIQNANVAHGIELSGAFQNNGILNVNHVNGDGFKLSDSSALLENYGTINLTAIYDYGLNCQYGTVHNEGNGSINMINGSSGMYIRSNCTFRMRGQSGLLIDQPGSNTAVRNYGHFTAGVNTNIVLRNGTTGFFNRSTAILRGNTIIESYDTGMNNRNASLDIYGSVSISNNENPLPIRNSTINIFSGGSLNLQDSGDGLYLLYDSQFNNYGELNLQNITDDYSKGIRMVDDSQFDNYGNILIQSVSGISSNGIVMDYGSSTFKNHSTGVLEITDGDDIGILADENTTFINDGELHIDNFKFGIFLTGGSFFNQSQSEFLALSITNAALKITEGGYLLNTGTFSHVDYINALNSLNIQKGSVLNSSCGYMSLGAR
ncbi:MAG: hypothetical protein MRY78_02335, partial [Saprospiraceae bacterium]|nr:hypothetical protein [Saprospiraceae bacterium]